MKNTFGKQAIQFFQNLTLDIKLPNGVRVMNPYRNPKIMGYTSAFFRQFFWDKNPRVLVFGINPGRFGAGITGITFTDPVALEEYCGIPNDLAKKRELSSIFIYKFIRVWGGPKKFYKNFYLTAVSPLGFLKDSKNYNFYDHPKLLKNIEPFLVKSIKSQINFGAYQEAAIVLGTGKIKQVFNTLNKKYNFFKNIYSIEHPRFIMQYRRKKLPYFIKKYRKVFLQAKNICKR
ncbi:MAG: uracil-DNA glycosylase family protein [Candidatus Paceibacteria bacterium]